MSATTPDLVALAMEALRGMPHRPLSRRRARRASDAVHDALAPHMDGVLQWWVLAEAHETPAAYARRAAHYAAQRLGLIPDAAAMRAACWLASRGREVQP